MRFGRLIVVASSLVSACTTSRPLTGRGSDGSCTVCHGGLDSTTGAPPNDAHGNKDTIARGVGAHTAHLTAGLVAGPMDCAECHEVPSKADVATHLDGTAKVAFGTLARTGGLAPSWSPTSGTCQNTYCHGTSLAGGSRTTPSWTRVGAGEAACGTCHGVPPPAPHPAVADGIRGCYACHPESVDAQGTILQGGKHLDGHLDGGAHPAGWGTVGSDAFHGDTASHDLAPCQTCHGADLGGSGAAPSCAQCHQGWRTSCTFCHGDRATGQAAPPRALGGGTATTQRGVGAHGAHLTAGPLSAAVACDACHVVPTDVLSPGHLDGGATLVTFSGVARGGGAQPTFDSTAVTCQNTYCHGATLQGGTHTTPVWTSVGTGEAVCGSCHSLPPGAPHAARTDCGTCHEGYTASSVRAATHVDGKVDVVGLACSSCHGVSTRAPTTLNPMLAAAPPQGTAGETAVSQRAVGAHQAHLTGANLGTAVACEQCHVVPSSMSHSDGAATVTFGTLARTGGAAPSWDGATCAGSYCHGNFKNGKTTNAPTWTSASGAACGSCHALPPAGTHPARSDCGTCHPGYTAGIDPTRHIDGKVDVVGLTCTTCHGTAGRTATPLNPQLAAAPPQGSQGETATTSRAVGAHMAHLGDGPFAKAIACVECHVVPTDMLHSDGSAQVTFGATAKAGGAAPGWDGTTCTGSYCHGAFTGGAATNAPTWTGANQAPCGSCHATPPNDPIHPVRTDCGSCHPGYSLTQANLALHVNGVVDVAGLGCAVCHGTSTRTATTLNPQLPAAPPNGVHGETAATQRPVGAHQAHLVGDTLSSGVACGQCHVVPTSLAHRDGQVPLAFGALATQGSSPAAWSASAGTCTGSYCHGNTLQGGTGKTAGASWTATSVACDACHGLPPLTGALKSGMTLHAFHVVSERKDCVVCHGTGYSAGTTKTVAKATHIDGAVKVGGTGSSISSWSSGTHSCTPTSGGGCHGRETW